MEAILIKEPRSNEPLSLLLTFDRVFHLQSISSLSLISFSHFFPITENGEAPSQGLKLSLKIY